MTRPPYSDDDLMAFADGEADADLARAIAAAAADDAELARRIAVFAGTRDALRLAAGARPLPPVPPELAARVRATLDAARAAPAGNVVPLAPRRAQAPARPAWQPLALAASLAFAAGLTGGVLGGVLLDRSAPPDTAGLRFAGLDGVDLAPALDRLASGQRQGAGAAEVAIIASFRDSAGSLCREAEVTRPDGGTVVAVACRDGGAWVPQLAVVAQAAAETGYAPASSMDTLEAWLAAVGAGPALSAEEEAAALRAD